MKSLRIFNKHLFTPSSENLLALFTFRLACSGVSPASEKMTRRQDKRAAAVVAEISENIEVIRKEERLG